MSLMWETVKSRHWRLLRAKTYAGRYEEVMWIGRGVTQQAGFGFLGKARGAHANNFQNHVFKGYIRILLIKTNLMIYICYIKHGGKRVVCVLTVRDDKLNMKDIKNMSSELAKG